MKFSNLQVDVVVTTQSKKINIAKDLLKIKAKPNKAQVREIEPGIKIGTGQFLSVSQFCDICNRVCGHAHKPEKRKMICLECKAIKTY
jgi:hypothetical protein